MKQQHDRRNNLKTLYAVLIVLIAWSLLSRLLDTIVLPTPRATFEAMATLFVDKLLPHTLISYARLLIALAVASLVGGLIGIICGLYSKVEALVIPIVDLFYPIPRIAFLPLFLIWFGLGEVSKVIVMVAVAVFYFILPVHRAIKQLPASYQLIAQTLDFNRWQWFYHVVLPACLPAFFTALKLTIGAAMAALFFAENVASTTGIAYYIMNAWSFSNYPAMYAGIVLLCIMGGILFAILNYLEQKLTPWLQERV
ncbi:ABC transporter permease [Aerococcaceae bacterium zg-BR22]|uniref:ABC transporter permease n=1 Tax=Aerococcaceae bacterium zg-1292 TaxID=2774330 RepID=UPI0040640465|nr:ABC transporter permease [Aerococcaceae bacterium zg-BR22]